MTSKSILLAGLIRLTGRLAFLFAPFAFLFPQLAFAFNLPEFSGTYSFQAPGLQLQIAQSRITVVNNSSEASNYLKGLQQNGYTCQTVTSATYDCKKLSRQIPENSSVRNSVINQYLNQSVSFQRTQTGYEQTNDSPLLQEFEKNQLSVMGQVQFQKTKLSIVNSILKVKLVSQTSDAAAYFYLNQKGQLSSQIQLAAQKKASQNPRFVTRNLTNYVYEAVWMKTSN